MEDANESWNDKWFTGHNKGHFVLEEDLEKKKKTVEWTRNYEKIGDDRSPPTLFVYWGSPRLLYDFAPWPTAVEMFDPWIDV